MCSEVWMWPACGFIEIRLETTTHCNPDHSLTSTAPSLWPTTWPGAASLRASEAAPVSSTQALKRAYESGTPVEGMGDSQSVSRSGPLRVCLA